MSHSSVLPLSREESSQSAYFPLVKKRKKSWFHSVLFHFLKRWRYANFLLAGTNADEVVLSLHEIEVFRTPFEGLKRVWTSFEHKCGRCKRINVRS